MPEKPAPKPCVICGREIEWRRKWARDWEQVRYCSDACRRRKNLDLDGKLEDAILRLLSARKAGASICPSEAAREVMPSNWRPHMEPARMAARRLVAKGRVVITQDGCSVDPSRAKGPIRISLASRRALS